MNTDAHVRPGALLTPVFRQVIRFAIAPLALSFCGFHIMDFLLSGVYSWPRTSRIIVLTFAVIILSYEFVYKENIAQVPTGSRTVGLKVLLSSCVIPFMVGSLALVFLLALSR
jgi:hypothetical protein